MTMQTFTPDTRIIQRMGFSKPSHAEMRRIERLVEMDKRRMECLAVGDTAGLLILADEYEHLGRFGCPNTAAQIRLQAGGVSGKFARTNFPPEV